MAPPAGRNPCWGKNGSMLKRADARPLFFGASWGVSRSGARYFWHCCGAQNFFAASRRALEILTAATRSPRCIRHRRRSVRSLRRPHFFQQRKKWGKERRQKLRFCISSRAMPVANLLLRSARSRRSSCVVPSKDCLSNSAAAADANAEQRFCFYRRNSERQRRRREVSSSYGTTTVMYCERVGNGINNK